MANQVEFSKSYKLLNSLKDGGEGKQEDLDMILSNYKNGVNAKSFLEELGQNFFCIGVQELFKYANTTDLQLIGQLTKENWEALAEENKGELPPHLANKMISYAKENQLSTTLSAKWKSPKREVEKHVMPMARYITEGIIDVLE